jgi:hypothetical protein
MRNRRNLLLIIFGLTVFGDTIASGESLLPGAHPGSQPTSSPEKLPRFDMTIMCGPSCLWQIAHAYGKSSSLDAIRTQAQTDPRNGTTMEGMVEAAHYLGLPAVVVQTDIYSLKQDPRTAILLLKIGANGHYVILDKIESRAVRVLDGGVFHTLSMSQLKSAWKGYAVLVGQAPTSDTGGSRRRFGTVLQVAGWTLLGGLAGVGLWRVFSWHWRRTCSA